MTTEIKLKTPKDIKILNNIAFEYGEKIIVSDKSFIVDARSLLALFALVGTTVKVIFPDHCDIDKMKKVIKKLAVLA